jgi:drug/metabolite transporter (DMT)-like permease
LAFTKAFSLINPSVVILLQKLQPVVAISLAYLLLGEKIGKKFLLWSVLCLAGSLLIGHKDILNMNTWNELGTDLLSGDKFVGYGYAILAVVSWGSCTVFGKKLMKSGFSETDIMAGRFFMGFLILIPLMVSTPSIIVQSPIVWGKIFLMVALSGALGMGLYYKGLGRLSARSCSLAELFFPVAAVGVNWIFLNASLDAVQLLGAGLLLLGSTVIQIKHY